MNVDPTGKLFWTILGIIAGFIAVVATVKDIKQFTSKGDEITATVKETKYGKYVEINNSYKIVGYCIK